MKKSLLLILLSIFSFATIHAEITWTLSDDGTLTISGTNMPDYESYYSAPWSSQYYKINKVVIESGVTNIGNYAFYNCSYLTSVTIPNSVLSIGSEAFNGCSSLTSITIPKSVTSIEDHAFNGCYGLTYVTIPNSVTSIKDCAFAFFFVLTSIFIPNSVTYISNSAFSSCSGLTSIIVAKNNSKYDSRDDCNAIIETQYNRLITGCKNTIIPNSVTNIGEYAFYGSSDLTSIIIPNSVISIGYSAFQYCLNLISVTIPYSVTSIGIQAFDGCHQLASIIVEKNNPIYDSRDNCNAIIEKQSNTLISGCKNTIIPNSVKNIRDCAFSTCINLKSITIPNSVTSIGRAAFNNCSNITSITIPNSITNIGIGAFSDCTGLISIISEASTPPTCSSYSFYNVNKSIPVYVPANSITKYKVADEWKDFTNIQAIPGTSLTDGTPYTNNLQLNGREVSYTRTFNNTSWQSLYIPFSLNYADWKDDFEVAYINGVRQLDKDDNGTIDETIMDVIKIKSGSTTPNMPYLIKAKTTGEKTFYVSDATLYPAEENSVDCSTTIAKYTFTGTYNTISSATMIANNYYGMGGGELIQSDGSNDLNPYRWYMKVESRNPSYNASNAAKTITINVIGDEEEEMTTGIRQLQITNDELPVYDLNGRKVNENNLKPGIYVKNGKKFVVK